MAAAMAQRRAGPHDEQLAQITVAHLSDASQPLFAPGRTLARGQTEEGGELPAAGEGAHVRYRRHDRRSGDRADPGMVIRRRALSSAFTDAFSASRSPGSPHRSRQSVEPAAPAKRA